MKKLGSDSKWENRRELPDGGESYTNSSSKLHYCHSQWYVRPHPGPLPQERVHYRQSRAKLTTCGWRANSAVANETSYYPFLRHVACSVFGGVEWCDFRRSGMVVIITAIYAYLRVFTPFYASWGIFIFFEGRDFRNFGKRGRRFRVVRPRETARQFSRLPTFSRLIHAFPGFSRLFTHFFYEVSFQKIVFVRRGFCG